MHPFANIPPEFTMFAVFLIVAGPIGLAVTARTLYLVIRKVTTLSNITAIALTGTVMSLFATALYLALGIDHAIQGMCIIGATEMLIMGTPLARFHALTTLDPAVAARVAAGPKSWFDKG